MIEKERAEGVKEKTSAIKKASRKQQLDLRFKTIRKHMIRTQTQLQVQQKRQEQTFVIDGLLNRLKQNQPNAVFNLWEHCLSFSFRYLTQNQILLLVSKLKDIIKTTNNREDVIMGVWLISNWTTTISVLTASFDELIYFLNELLGQNTNQKLQQYIIYSFANLCTDPAFAKQIIKLSILDKVLELNTFGQKDGDLAFLLRNCLQALPVQFHFQPALAAKLLSFIKHALKKCREDYVLRADCFYIINKLLHSSESTENAQAMPLAQNVIVQLAPQLKSLVLLLQAITQFESCRQMFNLLTTIAQKTSKNSCFFDQQLQQSVWNNTKAFLTLQNLGQLQQKQDFYDLAKEICKFLPNFISVTTSTLKQQTLQWLFQQCLFGQNVEWQQKVLIILAQNLETEQQIIQLCEAKLQSYKVLDEPAQAMLSSLDKMVCSSQGAVRKLKQRDQLCLFLSNLQFDQREEISRKAKNILKTLEQPHQNNRPIQLNFNAIQTINMQEQHQRIS